jgi:3-oxoacyl-[acyl-carrier-protein] synthase-1
LSNAAVEILGVGLSCSLGKSFSQACNAYFANERNFVKSRKGPIGVDGAPMTLSCAIPFEDVRNFELRLQKLFAGAADDLTTIGVPAPVPLRLVVPRWLANHDIGKRLRIWIGGTYPRLFSGVEMLTDGDTLALYEIVRGANEISGAQLPGLVIGAIDSFMDAELLDLLAMNGRIYARQTPHGLVPGEAAALFSIGKADGPNRPVGALKSLFTGFEREKVSSPQGIIGRGLAKPLRQAFETFAPDRFLADLNGERWRSEDLGFALSGALIPQPLVANFETPLGNTGDCGAANGMVLASFALASKLLQANAADGQDSDPTDDSIRVMSIVSTSHPDGPRCVAAIESYRKKD